MGLLILIIIATNRSTDSDSSRPGCLMLSLNDPTVWFIDVTHRSLLPIKSDHYLNPLDNSPDGRYTVYLEKRYSPDFNRVAIWDGTRRIFTQKISSDYGAGVSWSKDSQRLALFWFSTQRQNMLTIMDADGTHRQDIVLHSDRVQSYGWSADGQYIAISVQYRFYSQVYFFSTHDLRLPVYTINVGRIPPWFIKSSYWSPHDHLFLLSPGNWPLNQVYIVSPEKGVVQQFDTIYRSAYSVLWSPDNQFVLVEYAYEGRTQFDLFSVEGDMRPHIFSSAFKEITKSQLANPRPVWLSDGHVLSYLSIQSDRDWDTTWLTYDVDTGQTHVIVEHTNLVDLSPGPYQVIGWKKGDKFNVDLYRLDGQRQTALVQDADGIWATVWSWTHDRVAILWTHGYETRLTTAPITQTVENLVDTEIWSFMRNIMRDVTVTPLKNSDWFVLQIQRSIALGIIRS